MNPLQIVWILSGIMLALIGVFFMAVWRHGFRWLFSRRALRFHAGVVVSVLTIVVFYYAEESWRGKRAWVALQREVSARGELLELNSLATPAVPDEQNFAKAPGIPELLVHTNESVRDWAFYHGRENQWPSACWAFQQFTDLAKWQEFFRKHPQSSVPARRQAIGLRFPVTPEPQTPAADVLFALGKFETNLATLRAASQRPVMRLPLDFRKSYYVVEDLRRPLDSLYSAVHLLALRASAELAQEQAEAALQDILLALRLAELLREEPFDYVQRHRRGMLQHCLQPIWEGLAAHGWNNPQLAVLQKKMAELDLLADYRRGVHSETLWMMNLVDQVLAFVTGQPSEFERRHPPNESGERFLAWVARTFYPVGWLYHDKTWIYRFYERHPDPLQAVSLRSQPRNEFPAGIRTISDPMLVTFVLPKLREVFGEGSAQTLILHTFFQQAATDCALERFRLAQGQYPATLEALVPGYLRQVPADILARTHSNLKYHRTDEGGFRLYSVGLNRVDDGGKPSQSTEQRHSLVSRLSEGNSDLVWR
jgi:hypothetical protein